jgi:hypothetical protein
VIVDMHGVELHVGDYVRIKTRMLGDVFFTAQVKKLITADQQSRLAMYRQDVVMVYEKRIGNHWWGATSVERITDTQAMLFLLENS